MGVVDYLLLKPGNTDQTPKTVPKIGNLVIPGEYSVYLMGCTSSPQFEGTGKH